MNNTTMPVSVVMPVYNAGDKKDLDIAIRSILNQEFSQFELILCDDASTDDTLRRLEAWKTQDARIVLLRNEKNEKAGSARNRAIAMAKGEFIALMDSDDYSYPDRLTVQVDYLRTHPEVDFVGGRGVYFQEVPGDRSGSYWFVPSPKNADFLMTLPFVHASLMFRKEILVETKGYCTQGYATRSEDYDLLMRCYSGGHRGVNIDRTLYGIRVNEDTYKRRRYRYRFHECIVKWKGFIKLGLMPRGIPYALKPLIVGLIPTAFLERWKKNYYRWQEEKF